MKNKVTVCFLVLWIKCLSGYAIASFLPANQPRQQFIRHEVKGDDFAYNVGCSKPPDVKSDSEQGQTLQSGGGRQKSRRDWLQDCSYSLLGSAGSLILGTTFLPLSATAEAATTQLESSPLSSSSLQSAPDQTLVLNLPAVEMKTFLDPMGQFVVQIPKRFFAIRRSQNDLPDAKGQGRRGSAIFTAGDLSKAEVISIERFPIQGLLEENGILVSANSKDDDLSTFSAIGKPNAVATLLNQHREKSRPGQSTAVLLPDSWSLSPNGKELEFAVKAEIEVQKPELLMEQYGVSRLFRITVAKASLESNDGNVTAVFCSALEKDYEGPDGEALRFAAKSFRALDQTTGNAKS